MIRLRSSLPTMPLYISIAYILIGKMIRRATLSLNEATKEGEGSVTTIIDKYLKPMQNVINMLWDYRVFTDGSVDRILYTSIKTPYYPTTNSVK